MLAMLVVGWVHSKEKGVRKLLQCERKCNFPCAVSSRSQKKTIIAATAAQQKHHKKM